MFWCISVGLLIAYLIEGESAILITSGLYAIGASLAAIACHINKIVNHLTKEKEVQS